MTVKIFFTVIYLGLTFTSLAEGQYFPDGSRTMFNPPSQPPGNPYTQPFHPQNVAPGSQSPGFNQNPQNVRQAPNFHPFPSPPYSDFSSLFSQSSSLPPARMNQPTSFAPQSPVPYNPTYNPQRPSSSFPYPQQNNPFNPGAQGPGSIFTSPQQDNRFNRGTQGPALMSPQASPFTSGAQGPSPMYNNPHQASPFNRGVQDPRNIFTNPGGPFFTRPQQASTLNSPPTYLLPTSTDIINPSTLKLFEDAINPAFTSPQQGRPSYINPQETVPTSPYPQQTRPLNPQPTSLLYIPTPEQSNPSYTNPQKTIPNSAGPPQTNSNPTNPQKPYQDYTGTQQSNSDLAIPQQITSDSTIPQPTYSDSTIPQQTTSDTAVPQTTDTDSTVPQQSASDSTVPQKPASDSVILQPTDSVSPVPQQPTSDSINPQKPATASDDAQPITSPSETSSSISNAPENSGSEPHQPVHVPHSRNTTTQYIPRSENSQTSRDPLRGLRIVCLFNNRHFYRNGFTPAKLEPHLCTHLNYEFAILDPKTHEMIIGEPDLDMGMNFYQEAIDLKHVNPKLKVLVSLGGWSDSTKKYSELASDPALRKNFVEKAVEFLMKHEFDGMDLAWEYPNCWQGAIGISPKDKANFVDLLKDIKEGFKPHGLLLSVSVGAIKREVEAAYDVPAISKIVDYINVMTYDMHGPWEPVTGHHMQFEQKPGDKDPYCNVKGGMQVWIEKGAPKRKLNMGAGLYGRTYRCKDPNQCCEMGSPAVGPGDPGPVTKEGGIMNYHEICKFLNDGKYKEKEDKLAGFYACSDDGQWVGYDPPVMMVRKAKYVVDYGLGGMLLKDMSGDDSDGDCFNMPFPILRMVKMEMIHKAKRKYP